MNLWLFWWSFVKLLRPAFSRSSTFLWFALSVAATCIRPDLAGVTSMVRALGLTGKCYPSLLGMFHSTAINLDKLAQLWTQIVMKLLASHIEYSGDRPVFLADGIKISKTGRKMPGVKRLHQSSDNNNKASFIFGHSCQAISVLIRSGIRHVALPLRCMIHEGVIFNQEDTTLTLLDKLINMTKSLDVTKSSILVADAYYTSAKIILPLLKMGWHLVSAARMNAVAYKEPVAPIKKRRGRPKIYGAKVSLRTLFEDESEFTEVSSPIYDEKGVVLRYRSINLVWRPVARVIQFVLVSHPVRGKKIIVSTDVNMCPVEIIRLYGLRFKIEFSFKQALYVIGTYSYHFWMATMKRRQKTSGDQDIRNEDEIYQQKVERKIKAYHLYIQVGVIAQGLLQAIAIKYAELVWRYYGSWIRTIRPGVQPSEWVAALALRNSLPEFLTGTGKEFTLALFLHKRIDLSRSEGTKLVA